MLSWITGARISDVAELDAPGVEPSMLEPPETPAPIFAVNAFKHAFFGTPAPEETVRKPAVPSRTTSKARFQELDDRGQKSRSRDTFSPTKPTSILMTPGTLNGRRKNVTFGSGVIDNEGKRPAQGSKTGIPDDCPGKFPSPYTTKEKRLLEATPSTIPIALRQDNTHTTTGPAGTRPIQRAKDDADVTLDMMEPRSQSGRYWKEQHVAYAAKSEKEIRKLIAKQKLAKDYAKKKDAEASELKLKLDSERKKHRRLEKSWETSMKDMQERLRKAVADNSRYAAELALLRQQLDDGMEGVHKDRSKATRSEDRAASLDLSLAVPQLPELQIDESRPRSSSSPLPIKAPSTSTELADSDIVTTAANVSSVKNSYSSSLPAPASSEPMSTPTPATAPNTQERTSSRLYRVSKRPITVTTARVRSASSTFSPKQSARSTTATHSKQTPAHVPTAEDSDMDLWAISNLETSHAEHAETPKLTPVRSKPREALVMRTANDSTVPPQASPVTGTSVGVDKTIETDLTGKKAERQSEKPAVFDWPKLHTSDSPRHFPGSPIRARKPTESSLANAKTNLPESREEQARQRLAARRMGRKPRIDAVGKENVGGA